MPIRTMISLLFAAAVTITASHANEIGGFRIGMSLVEARSEASRRKMELQTVTAAPASRADWTSFVVNPSRISISFCADKIAAITHNWKSTIHEFAVLIQKYNSEYGQASIASTQHYNAGKPSSHINARWTDSRQVSHSLSLNQWGEESTMISTGLFDVSHACR